MPRPQSLVSLPPKVLGKVCGEQWQRVGISLLLTCFVLLSSSSCSSQRTIIEVGQAVPKIELKDLKGRAVSLSSYQGKYVLLAFMASWCATCKMELPELKRLHAKLRGHPFSVLAIGVADSAEALTSLVQRNGLDFPVLVDSQNQSNALFGLTGIPESFLIDKTGKFMMIIDPADNFPTLRIVGPRAWGSKKVEQQLLSIIGE